MELEGREEIGKCKITLKRAKKNISYPMVRFPSEYAHLAGKQARIYRVDNSSYLVVIQDGEELYNSPPKLHNPEGFLSKSSNPNYAEEMQKNTQNPEGCRGPGLNATAVSCTNRM